jgi:Spy/CpxP family protein refolding chaperone
MRRFHVVLASIVLFVSGASVAAAQNHGRPALPLLGNVIARGHLFRGIPLTDDEKTKIQGVRQQYRAARQPLVTEVKPQIHAARAARQKGDTAAARNAMANVCAIRRKAGVLLVQGLKSVHGALTPEHQMRFAANLARARRNRAGSH